jgi:signal transduction histidine kinase
MSSKALLTMNHLVENISESIRRLVKLIESDIRYTNYNIILDLDESIFIPINEKVFDKILRSIIENAIDFSNTDDLIITIQLSQSDNYNIISVTDNGLGITKLSKEEIFRPFYTTSPHKLGMGLFLSESYVYQTLHGRLTYDDEYHDGAKFDICIPI